MRSSFRVPFALLSLLLIANFVIAQLPGGGRPTQAGKGETDSFNLLRKGTFNKELKVTDEQLAKIPDAILRALADVLTPDQLKRYKQIDLQLKGAQAFFDTNVQIDLLLTEKQGDAIKGILEKAPSVRDLLQGAKDDTELQALRDKLRAGTAQVEMQKDVMDKCVEVLTVKQYKLWKEMVGDEYKPAAAAVTGRDRKDQ